MRNEHGLSDAEAEEKARLARFAAIERETAGMHHAFVALQPLDHMGRRRALRWLSEALDNDPEPPF
jgi:hypothetical protein